MRLLEVGPAAKQSGYCENWLRYLADTGRLPVIRTAGGRRLFKERDVLALAARRRQRQEAVEK